MKIEKVAVLGAGVMGAQIAGHLANCGFDVLLLDINNVLVMSSLEKLSKTSPPALFSPVVLKRVRMGNIEDNLKDACECDWVIEVVPEKLEIKQDIYSRLENLLTKPTIITSNTSGISLSILTRKRTPEFKKSFFITHFFNPVRFMRLVELIKGPETSEDFFLTVKDLLLEKMGKGVVEAKDTPGFIANRIGVFSAMNGINKAIKNGWPIEVVDSAMGAAAAFPKSAIFRTADLVGIDTLLNVAKNTYNLCPTDSFREMIKPASEAMRLVNEGRMGQKTGSGFYKKEGGLIKVLDWSSFEYREMQSAKFESIKKTRKIQSPSERVKVFFSETDTVAAIAKELLTDLLVYAAYVTPEISDSIVEVDNAMKWGYNWELGPFEILDSVGTDRLGDGAPELIKRLKTSGYNSFYNCGNKTRYYFDFKRGDYREIKRAPEKLYLSLSKDIKEPIIKNESASLVDLGDGVVCCEFHSKMNSIDPDIISVINSGLDLLEAGKYLGMVIANEGDDFCVGANLFLIAMAAGSGDFKQIERIVKSFQDTLQRVRLSPRPVVVAPFSRAFGGGCEICLATNTVVAASETYMGLVELGVGLIPAGGGCKNLLLHMEADQREKHNPKDDIWFAAKDGGPFPKVGRAFETIALAKVSGSALGAMELGYIGKNSRSVLDRERLVFESKKQVLSVADNYDPPEERHDILLPGNGGKMALVNGLRGWRDLEKITEYEVVLATQLAHVLCGGGVPTEHYATEQDILDLEREAFLKLCGMQPTMERIQYMLTTGKPLRN